jgi:hypothetical protein
MYSKNLQTIFFCLPAIFLFSCAGKTENTHDHPHGEAGESVWKEMDDFHMIMAETYHPYKDSLNLEPAKNRAAELVNAAEQWAAAPLPHKVDNEEVKSNLEKLKSEAATLAESVKSADDNVIGDQLTRLHDTFHQLEEAWYGGH